MYKTYRYLRGRPLLFLMLFVCSGVFIFKGVWYHEQSQAIRRLYHSDDPIQSGDSPSQTADNTSTVSWIDKRKALVSEGGPTKVFILGYTRGGASAVSDIFNHQPEATMWHQPDAAFFTAYFGVGEENFPQHDLYFSNMSRRSSSDIEQRSLVDYYNNMLGCQYTLLPPEALGHWFVSKSAALEDYSTCMGLNLERDYSLNKCIRLISPICGNTVESSLQQKCPTIIATTQIIAQENLNLFQEMMHGTTNLFEFNAQTYQMVSLLSDQLHSIGSFSEFVLSRLRWFVQHRLCIEMVRIFNNNCMDMASSTCRSKAIHTVQVNRLNMESLEPLIQASPDLYVMHIVRDPRAITISRIRTEYLVWDPIDKRPQREAGIVCHQMEEDLKQRRYLEAKYPGVITQIKYEDLVEGPIQVGNDIFSFIGKPVPDNWPDIAKRVIHNDEGPVIPAAEPLLEGVHDLNAVPTQPPQPQEPVSHSMKWMYQIPVDQVKEITEICGSVITALGYTDPFNT